MDHHVQLSMNTSKVPTQYRSSVLESPVEFCNVYGRNRSMTVQQLGHLIFLEKELNLLCIATTLEVINILRIREKNRLDTTTTITTTTTTIGKEC